MAISSTTSSSASTSSAASSSTSTPTSSSSTKSESSAKSESASTSKSGSSDSVKLSQEAEHHDQPEGLHADMFAGLAGNFAESLPGAFCAAPEGMQLAAQGELSAGLDAKPLSGKGQAAAGVTASSNKALVNPDGNLVDTELRNAQGLGTEANLKLGTSSSDSKTAGQGTSWQATLPQGRVAGCADPNNAESWQPGTDLSFTEDQFQQSNVDKSLAGVSLSFSKEQRQGEMQGRTKDGDNVVDYQGQLDTELIKHQAGVNWEKAGKLELVPGAEIKGEFGLELSFGRNESTEQFNGNFTEKDPNGNLKSGTLERTTFQSGLGMTAEIKAAAEANINGWTFGGGGTLGGTVFGNGTFQEQTLKKYANSQEQIQTDVYAETQGQRQSEFVKATDAKGVVTETQTVTMATDPSYRETWIDTFGPDTKFQGDNAILTLNDKMAQDIATLAKDKVGTAMGDVFSTVTNARELAQALTEQTNFSNNHLLETIFLWQNQAREARS